MSRISVYAVVEGQTEQTFVREVLAPELVAKGIDISASLIGKLGHKGGDVRFDRAKLDIGKFLKQRSNTYVTTMFDYFRIEPNWPGKATINQQIQSGATLNSSQKANILEDATHHSIVNLFSNFNARNRFIPYIEMHEFEALLFSNAEILSDALGLPASQIYSIINSFNNPEEINDNPHSAPSKRLENLYEGYRKVVMGKTISESIGISTIRKQCPHFNDWLTRLDEL